MNKTKTIDTLVDDIYNVVDKGTKVGEDTFKEFAHSLSTLIKRRLDPEEMAKEYTAIRISNMGKPCDRQLWYSVNTPEDAEPIPPQARVKFLYGDLIEELFLFLARLAGHKVEGEQEEVHVHGIPGHRDAIVDGTQVDVKSANSRSFDKFKYHKLEEDDTFGYLRQNDMYLEAGQDDERVTNKEEHAFLAIDKELGHVVVDKYPRMGTDYESFVRHKRAVLEYPDEPERAFKPVAHQKSGNEQLAVPCRYCPFKKKCWPTMRTFLYSSGPVFLTRVMKLPKVDEVK